VALRVKTHQGGDKRIIGGESAQSRGREEKGGILRFNGVE